MGRVFAIQNPTLVDKTGTVRPKFDLSSASRFGDLVFMLGVQVNPGGNPSPDYVNPVIAQLRAALADFCDEDSLLLIGNPVLIGVATALATRANSGRARVLQWDSRASRYVQVEVQL